MIKNLFVVTLLTAVCSAYGQEMYSVDPGAILIDGYDPVSYFDDEPTKGKPSIFVEVEGRKLLFSSPENKQRYLDNTNKYFPQYGGWCAIAMVDDTFVIPNYDFYKIQDDKLYFFRVQAFFNGLTYWDRDPEKNQLIADKNYRSHFD
jgi:hypothetical protein